MDKKIILFFILVSNFLNAQLKYHFDYALLYDHSIRINENQKAKLYLINSNNNDYSIFVFDDNDSIHSNMYLVDYKGIALNIKVNKKLFYKSETINSNCNPVSRFGNIYKKKAEEYCFEKHNDTLINDTLYFHYEFKSIKSLKYQKRKNIVSTHYIIDKNSNQFKPFLYHSTIYNNWVKTLKLPNGIIKMVYDVNVDKKIIFKQQLIKLIKIDKNFTIPEDCYYIKTLK